MRSCTVSASGTSGAFGYDRQRQQTHFFEAGCFQPTFDDLRDPGDGALAHGPGDHAGLAEPTPAGAPPKDLHTHALVHRFGERHERRFRVRPLVEIHQRVLTDPPRDVRAVRRHPLDAPIRQVLHVVEAGNIDRSRPRQSKQQLFPTTRSPLTLPLGDDAGDQQDGFLAIPEDRGVQEIRDRLRIEGRMPAGDDERLITMAICRVHRNPREIECVEHVRVSELGREGQPEDVEISHRSMTVDGELRNTVFSHQFLEIGPHRVGALGEHVLASVENLVQDLHTLIRGTDLVSVGVHQRPPHNGVFPVLDDGVHLATDVLDWFADSRQQRFEAIEVARPDIAPRAKRCSSIQMFGDCGAHALQSSDPAGPRPRNAAPPANVDAPFGAGRARATSPSLRCHRRKRRATGFP